MIWTTTKPTKPGRYWWRRDGFPMEMCEVKQIGLLLYAIFADGRRYSMTPIIGETSIVGEWSGPIKEE